MSNVQGRRIKREYRISKEEGELNVQRSRKERGRENIGYRNE